MLRQCSCWNSPESQHAGGQLAGPRPRNPIQFTLETKATSALVFNRGKNRDLCLCHSVFVVKARKFLVLKRGGVIFYKRLSVKCFTKVFSSYGEETGARDSDASYQCHPGTTLLGTRPEIEIRNQVFRGPFSCVQLALSSKVASILFSTAKTRGRPILLKSDGKVPNEGAFQKCPHKHFKCFV